MITFLLALRRWCWPSRGSTPQVTIEPHPRRCRGSAGQATTEYALVLLAAALVGLLVVGWATAGGGAERVGELFDNVIESVIDKV